MECAPLYKKLESQKTFTSEFSINKLLKYPGPGGIKKVTALGCVNMKKKKVKSA